MEDIEKERLRVLYTRAGYPTEFTENLLNEVSKPENPDLEKLISEYEETASKTIVGKKSFQEKFLQPKIDEENSKYAKGLRGKLFSQFGVSEEVAKTIIANAKGNTLNEIADLIADIKNNATNTDDMTKKQLADYQSKVERLDSLLKEKDTEIEQEKEKSTKSEIKAKENILLLDAFYSISNKIIPNLNKDTVKKTAFSLLREKYKIDESGTLRYKAKDEPVYKNGSSDFLTIPEAMFSILEKDGYIVLSNPDDKDDKKQSAKVSSGGMKNYGGF